MKPLLVSKQISYEEEIFQINMFFVSERTISKWQVIGKRGVGGLWVFQLLDSNPGRLGTKLEHNF